VIKASWEVIDEQIVEQYSQFVSEVVEEIGSWAFSMPTQKEPQEQWPAAVVALVRHASDLLQIARPGLFNSLCELSELS
jgi:squalene cyclase